MSKESELSEQIVRQYARGLEALDLKRIAYILHPEFKFVYRVRGGGHGIRTDVRYIGHLYKTFEAMKEQGLSIKTELCSMDIYDKIDLMQYDTARIEVYKEMEKQQYHESPVRYLGIKLLPTHDRRIIFPMDNQLTEEYRADTPTSEVILLLRVKNGLICKIECYCTMSQFERNVKGKVLELTT